jgi:hypothetical protein
MKEYFYTITEGMIELGLRGTALNLFAIIYGYSQRGDGCCYASRGELARRCGVLSSRTIDSAMNELIEKGLVQKMNISRGGQILVAYSTRAEIAGGMQKLHGGCAKIAHGGCAKFAHIENIEEEKKIENNPPTPQAAPAPSMPPTVKAVADYARERGFADPEGFADYYVASNEAEGWKRKNGQPITNWKSNVLQWERYHKNERFQKRTNTTTITSANQLLEKFGL